MRFLTQFSGKLSLAVLAFVLPVLLAVPTTHAAGGYTWSQTLDGTSGLSMVSIASSSSGKIQSSLDYGGNIYTSNDFGATWKNATTGTPASGHNWANISMSSSGQYQTALENAGDIWRSSDYGVTWNNATSGSSLSGKSWLRSATSSSGQYVIADDYNDIYFSSDYGVHWTNKTTSTALSGLAWSNVSMSSDGKHIYILEDTSAVYGSTDFGATWSKLLDRPDPLTSGLNVITTSANGQRVYAADYGGDIYVSNNYGATWTNTTSGSPLSGLKWTGISTSATGQYLVAMVNDSSGTNPTPMYVSRDYGGTWTNTTSGTAFETVYWTWVSMSASGERIVASANNYGIYAADDPSLKPPKPVITRQNITTTVSTGRSVTVNVLGGASGYDINTLSIVSGPSHGTAVDPPGDLTYTSAKGFTGTDSLVYQLCAPYDDSQCTQATLTFSVINAPNTGFGKPETLGFIGKGIAVASILLVVSGLLLSRRRTTN